MKNKKIDKNARSLEAVHTRALKNNRNDLFNQAILINEVTFSVIQKVNEIYYKKIGILYLYEDTG